jgi:hypothetical protein
MPLRCWRFIAADNRCASGVRDALPELILIYEPLPITTQARHYATRGSIMTAALPFDYGLSVLLVHFLTLQKRKNPHDGGFLFCSAAQFALTSRAYHNLSTFLLTMQLKSFAICAERVTNWSV